MIILHIVGGKEWREQENAAFYTHPSLSEVGFLHCAKIPDVVDAANCYYRGTSGLLLLCIDTQKVKPEIKWETSPYGVEFPHLCGRLNKDAIVAVLDFPIDNDGWFIFPEQLRQYAGQ